MPFHNPVNHTFLCGAARGHAHSSSSWRCFSRLIATVSFNHLPVTVGHVSLAKKVLSLLLNVGVALNGGGVGVRIMVS